MMQESFSTGQNTYPTINISLDSSCHPSLKIRKLPRKKLSLQKYWAQPYRLKEVFSIHAKKSNHLRFSGITN